MPERTSPTRIIIDTDPGSDIDDIYALAFALLRPELEVVGITTVTGPTDLRAALVCRLLQILGREDVLVAAGETWPMVPKSEEQKKHLASAVPNHCFAEDAGQDFPDAVDFIIDTVNTHPGEIGICAVGPFTNLGRALERDPQLGCKVKFLALMGMETHINMGEYNCATDPEASAKVVESGAPVFIGTWSVTRQVVFLPEDLDRLRAASTPLTGFLLDRTDRWLPLQTVKPGPVLYDVSPVTWVFAPEHYQTEQVHLSIELRGEYTRGWSVVTGGAPNCEITVSMDAPVVKDLVMDTLLGWTPTAG